MNVTQLKSGGATSSTAGLDSEAIIKQARANEVFFAVVGPVGAGSSRVVASLQRALQAANYEPITIKASDLIREWAEKRDLPYPEGDDKTLTNVTTMQDLGDRMREADKASVARAVIGRIARARAMAMDIPYSPGEVVEPDDKKRAYLIDSIRHPAEIQLLRRTYGQSFALIGVVCQETERERRVLGKYFTDPQRLQDKFQSQAREFIKRDADDVDNKHGQHVGDAFHQADFFVDNTKSDPKDDSQLLDEALGRLINIVTHAELIRPTIEETAMHHAHSARVRSACLSRQVGAALIDEGGTVVATGTNEVPRAGGGVYGEHFASKFPPHDDRCAFSKQYCSNNLEQNAIVEELIEQLPELRDVSNKFDLAARIRKTRLGSLIEFSRAVHAEMDAVLSAGRVGVSTTGTRLFVTTFPCHYCARHIVGAGVSEVQYIEPYPKSLALKLHCDAIEVDADEWNPPERISIAQERRLEEPPAQGRVLFRPFNGVAPRLYERAFEKTWELKDKVSGKMVMTPPGWGDGWGSFTVSYPELEAKLSES
ncbi:deoxycytidylate deaminase [Bosea sp. OAE752]|uniref:anti-phage dCTP deaminase n=1 Tax=Bosea sp. OAE752 TaxID=2663873 RepID=UPI003D1A92E7